MEEGAGKRCSECGCSSESGSGDGPAGVVGGSLPAVDAAGVLEAAGISVEGVAVLVTGLFLFSVGLSNFYSALS